MTFIFLFIIKNTHFIESHVVLSQFWKRWNSLFKCSFSSIFLSSPLKKKKKTFTLCLEILLYPLLLNYILYCLNFSAHVLAKFSFYLQFTIFLFYFIQSRYLQNIFLTNILLSVKYISWFHVVISKSFSYNGILFQFINSCYL